MYLYTRSISIYPHSENWSSTVIYWLHETISRGAHRQQRRQSAKMHPGRSRVSSPKREFLGCSCVLCLDQPRSKTVKWETRRKVGGMKAPSLLTVWQIPPPKPPAKRMYTKPSRSGTVSKPSLSRRRWPRRWSSSCWAQAWIFEFLCPCLDDLLPFCLCSRVNNDMCCDARGFIGLELVNRRGFIGL